MTKNDAVRVSDTIAFIRTANVPAVNMAQRNPVADLLRDKNQNGMIDAAMSQVMSQGSNWAIMNRDDVQTNRHYRRAIILLETALQGIHHSMATYTVNAMTDANLPGELGSRLNAITVTMADLNTKLALLKANPLMFLANNSFHMVGALTAGVMHYAFSFDPIDNKYTIAPEHDVTTWAYVQEDVFQLPVQQYATLPTTPRPMPPGGNSLNVAGSVVHGANLMVTTQLTGCSIVYYHNGGQLVAAHVQPGGGTNGETACTNLRADATLSHAPLLAVTNVFGPQAHKAGNTNNYKMAGRYNYCIGVRIGGTWELYAQQRTPGPAGGNKAWQIT